jgi:hypothetical protein
LGEAKKLGRRALSIPIAKNETGTKISKRKAIPTETRGSATSSTETRATKTKGATALSTSGRATLRGNLNTKSLKENRNERIYDIDSRRTRSLIKLPSIITVA